MRLFGAIEKFDKRSDGTLEVSGIASSDSVDSDGEQISSDAIKMALPDYMKFGNVREMHGHSAAGVCTEAEVMPDGKTRINTLIVDPTAIKKVTTGVYKGFSIGGEALSRQGKVVTRLRLSEISLVDRPANPEATFDLWKAEKITKTMDYKPFAKALGLADSATEAEILEAIAKKQTVPMPVPHPDVAGEIAKAIKASGDALETRLKALDEKIEASKNETLAKAEKAERTALVEQAGREGKVIPLDDDTIYGNSDKKVEAISLAALKTIVAKAQKSVAVASKAPKHVTQGDKTVDIEELKKTGFAKREDRADLLRKAAASTPGRWQEYFEKTKFVGQPQN